jgi:hypothetical protein
MQNRRHVEVFLQISLILICVAVLGMRFLGSTAQAQTCNGEPPLQANPTMEAWPQGKTISVKIFDSLDPPEEFDAID